MSDTTRFIAISYSTSHGQAFYFSVDVRTSVVVKGKNGKPRTMRRSKVKLHDAAESIADDIATSSDCLLVDVLPVRQLQLKIDALDDTLSDGNYKETDSGLYE